MDFCVTNALSEASVTLEEIDAISVTTGPGLIGGLIVGLMYAKGLSHVTEKKIIHINHLEGHILSPRLSDSKLQYPYLALLISGGHTELIHVKSVGNYSVLGRTLDDAAGECIDKVAKMLGLGYPGGPFVEDMAKKGNPYAYKLPAPMIDSLNLDLSFSGLKTAARLLIEKLLKQMDVHCFINDFCASFQSTIAQVLSVKSLKAISKAVGITEFVLVGGVACNLYIQKQIREALKPLGVGLVVPPKVLCTDNAAMIAWAGIERINAGRDVNKHCLDPRMKL